MEERLFLHGVDCGDEEAVASAASASSLGPPTTLAADSLRNTRLFSLSGFLLMLVSNHTRDTHCSLHGPSSPAHTREVAVREMCALSIPNASPVVEMW